MKCVYELEKLWKNKTKKKQFKTMKYETIISREFMRYGIQYFIESIGI